jgi:KaiC/GvpD/RAD55 family RecA-like ATPase
MKPGARSVAEDCVSLARALWQLVAEYGEIDPSASSGPSLLVRVPSSEAAWLLEDAAKVRSDELIDRGWLSTAGEWTYIHPHATRASQLVDLVSERVRATPSDRADLDYFTWAAIRDHYSSYLTDFTSDAAHAVLRVASGVLREDEARVPEDITGKETIAALVRMLSPALDDSSRTRGDLLASFYLECCRNLRPLCTPYRASRIWVDPEWLDAEKLWIQLVGLKTAIPQFDDLFGGGGLELVRCSEMGSHRGRVVLIRGRFGTGKSSLALALAAEVGRKGVAMLTPLEQSPEECLQYLKAQNSGEALRGELIDFLPNGADDSDVPAETLSHIAKTGRSTALAILRRENETLIALMRRIQVESAQLNAQLKLFVLDPVNSVRLDTATADDRQSLVAEIEKVCATGANLILTVEHDAHRKNRFEFLANIADTVIELSTSADTEYGQRYVEVLKSRRQQEQRGRHPMAIQSGVGVSIALSSASVLARLRGRTLHTRRFATRFGWKPLDDILGDRAIYQGDAVALVGKQGTFKTLLAMMYLQSSDWDEAIDGTGGGPASGLLAKSLVITAQGQMSFVQLQQSEVVQRLTASKKRTKEVEILALPTGFVSTAWILRFISECFLKAEREGAFFDRVVVLSVPQWELNCPKVNQDPVFSDALRDLFRSRGASSLFMCGDAIQGRDMPLHDSILDHANVLIELNRIEYHARDRVLLRAAKTASMAHSREVSELSLRGRHLRLEPSLLRLGRDGVSHPLQIFFYVFSDSPAQAAYYKDVADDLKTGLHIDKQLQVHTTQKERKALIAGLSMEGFRSHDVLEIIQLDEFEVPQLRSEGQGAQPALYEIEKAFRSEDEWKDVELALMQHAEASPGNQQRVIAVPYYQSVGVLLVNGTVANELLGSWESIATECDRWSAQADDDHEFFFWMPQCKGEDLNCLFLEIALAQLRVDTATGLTECELFDDLSALGDWLAKEPIQKSLRILWSLCRPLRRRARALGAVADDGQRVRGKVCRSWFTTLRIDPALPERTSIRALPGEISTMGEWYLAVSARSVGVQIGLEIIRKLTEPVAEDERARLGIGLPTRRRFYQAPAQSRGESPSDPQAAGRDEPKILSVPAPNPGGHEWDVNRLAELLHRTLSTAYRRSRIKGYAKLSPLLANHLEELLDLSTLEGGALDLWCGRLVAAVRAALGAS